MNEDVVARSIRYTVWPTFPPEDRPSDGTELNRVAAIEDYGLVTIEAMQTALLLNPNHTVALHGMQTELLVEFKPRGAPSPR